jgi:hypothetical protein
MASVRTLFKRRQRRRLRHSTECCAHLHELAQRYGVPAAVLHTLAGISNPANRPQFTADSLRAAIADARAGRTSRTTLEAL